MQTKAIKSNTSALEEEKAFKAFIKVMVKLALKHGDEVLQNRDMEGKTNIA
jgi:hypothetical protein